MPNYIYPPRPKSQFPPTLLQKYERSGIWVCQRKFNGTRSPIRVTADRQVFFWGRHGEPHKQFNASQEIKNQVLALDIPVGQECWLDAELLKNKTTCAAYKDKLVIFDVLMLGTYFLGAPDQMSRLEIVKKICRFPTALEPANQIALVVSPNLWMAETWDHDFVKHFQEKVHLDEIEGLFLRKRNSVIDDIGTREYETTWCIRCRKPHASGCYSH